MHVLAVFAHFEMSGSIDCPGMPTWKSLPSAPAFSPAEAFGLSTAAVLVGGAFVS